MSSDLLYIGIQFAKIIIKLEGNFKMKNIISTTLLLLSVLYSVINLSFPKLLT